MAALILGSSPITLNGLSLSQRDTATGLEIVTEDIQGWGSPAPTLQVIQKPAQHGSWSGASFLQPRTIVLEGYIQAQDGSTLQQAVDAINAAAALDSVTLAVTENGFTRTSQVRRQDQVLMSWVSDTAAQWSIQMIADDPRKYGASSSIPTALASVSGGLTFPITFPITWTGSVVTGIITIVNTGNIASPVYLRIDGPVQGPAITVSNSLGVNTFAMSYSIATGNYVLVDMEKRTVLENNQASRTGYVTQRGWLQLMPGVNTFFFTSNVYNASAMLTVTTSPAWL